ncbi:MAG: translation initiation factor IF-2 [Rhizomicrobium sp.]
MSESKDTSTRQKGQGPNATKTTLTLKKTETSTVKQSFSHGRTKAVVVEKKRTRGEQPAAVAAKPQQDNKTREFTPRTVPVHKENVPQRAGVVLRQLTDEEKTARAKALAGARIAEAEARKQAEIDAKRRAAEEIVLKKEREEAAKRKAEEDARKAAEEAVRQRAAAEAARRAEESAPAGQSGAQAPSQNTGRPQGRPQQARPQGTRPTHGAHNNAAANAEADQSKAAAQGVGGKPTSGKKPDAAAPKAGEAARRRGPMDEEESNTKKGVKAPVKTPVVKKEADRRRGKLTVTKALSGDDERMRSLASFRRHLQRANKGSQAQAAVQAGPREVTIPENITVAELANRMARRAVDVIKVLMKNGIMATVNDIIDADTADLVATEYGHTVKRVAESDVLEGLKGAVDDPAEMTPRPPIVTVMGHVDHGKTSLLDALRTTDVVAGEAGGITQHIGAYQVKLKSGQKITFIDTPGHAAFTEMRARGAKVTDIVILVVAADDGVMPQTIEALNHAKAAGVPIIVAINKIDKPGADPMRVKTELLQHEIQVEDLGGETIAVEISAKQGTGLEKLQEMVLLQSEVLELRANPNRTAEGAIIEAKLDRGRGPVATALIQRGTLKLGDIVVAGAEWGKVRNLQNERGESLESAGPSVPVEVLGLSGAPEAGDEFAVVDSEARAREITEYRTRKKRETQQAAHARLSLDQLLKRQATVGQKKMLPLVIKSDVQGSAEAIQGALDKLGTDEVAAQVLQSGVGGITESDVILAHASGGAIIGFNVRADKMARERAKRDGVEIRYYNIIYNVVDDVKAALSGMLAPETREKFLGNAEILEVFSITKVGKVAGCRVTEGQVRRGAKVRLIRDHVVIHEGELSTLKRFKDEVKEVQNGQECGMAFANYQDIVKGDVIEAFEVETIQREL